MSQNGLEGYERQLLNALMRGEGRLTIGAMLAAKAEEPPTREWGEEPPKNCDVCRRPIGRAFVDGQVRRLRVWGRMCLECHRAHGVGLGTGLGQRYTLIAGRWLKTAG